MYIHWPSVGLGALLLFIAQIIIGLYWEHRKRRKPGEQKVFEIKCKAKGISRSERNEH